MSPPQLRLFLVRHGETAANRELRYVGTRDEPLAETGAVQAERVAAALCGLPLAAVYASPLRRTAETGQRIATALGLPLAASDLLREQSFGAWEGMTRAEVAALGDAQGLELRRWESDPAVAPPGGESLVAVQERVLALVRELAEREERGRWVALVSHVGPIKALVCAALGVPLGAARRMFLDPGTVSVVDWDDAPVVRLFNAHGHLGWQDARWMKR